VFKAHRALPFVRCNLNLSVGQDLGFLWAFITFLINDVTDYGPLIKLKFNVFRLEKC